ncbi:hypothetical protein [Enhygromyxa salina]|uniref:hypothetical protein n=1 Tax=Enhygromyxa salina TaxID=215803 RepID=UPI000696A72D|nr:hypothetical protein [Enhygromyxa salina]
MSETATVLYAAKYVVMTDHDIDALSDFYLKRRRNIEAVVKGILRQVNLPLYKASVEQAVHMLLKTRTENDVTGQIGEIVSSFVLSHEYGVFLFGLSWPIRPFDVHRGNDVAGVCLQSMKVLSVESKATRDASNVPTIAAKAREGMSLDLLLPRFRLNIDDGQSRRAAIFALKKAMKKGDVSDLKFTSDMVEKLVSDEVFIRVGTVVHPRRGSRYDYDGQLEKLKIDDLSHPSGDSNKGTVRFPTAFVDIDVHDIDNVRGVIVHLESYDEDEL